MLRVFLIAAYLSLQICAPAQAVDQVDAELVLLADASNSIDTAEIKFQRQGYVAALTDPAVLAAIRQGPHQKIAITFIEWGDDDSQDIVVPWTVVSNLASAKAFAAALLAAPRKAFGSNAIGAAIARAQSAIEKNGFEGLRKVIDLSADSANNWTGVSIAEARAKALAAGIIINGLAVLCRDDDCSGRPVAYDLEKEFEKKIIGGPGSFVVSADSAKSFAAAVRRKLILELANRAVPPANMLRR